MPLNFFSFRFIGENLIYFQVICLLLAADFQIVQGIVSEKQVRIPHWGKTLILSEPKILLI
jgi:hypothetical protein